MQINFQNIHYPKFYNSDIPTKRAYIRKPLDSPCDTVSFSGEKDLMKMSDKKIFKRINKTICNRDNLIGLGGEARVYKIPNSEYCVRIAYYDIIYEPVLDRNISECDKINHTIAKFGEYSSIQKYIEGKPVLKPSLIEDKNAAKQTAKEIAQMPVSAFKNLLLQICNAYDKGMMFDCCWSNVIVNPKENKLTAIDFNKNIEEESLKPLSYVFSSLTTKYTTPEQVKTNANKILSAVLEEFEPAHEPFWNISNFDFSDLLRKTRQCSDFGKTSQCELLVQKLSHLKELKYKEIRGIDITQELNGTLKVIKALIRQTL